MGKRKALEMSGNMRLLWLGITVLGLLCGSATAGDACNTENGGSLYDRPLYNNELTVALPKGWRVVKTEPPGILKYDDITYDVQLDGRILFRIDITNNGDFRYADTTIPTTLTIVTNDGIFATEHRRAGVLTTVVAKPPCGGFRYVLMWPVTKDPGERRQVEAAMKTLTCVASPRPGF